MKNTVKELNTREKKALLTLASDCIEKGMNKKETIKVLQKKLLEMNVVENSGAYNQMLSVCIAFYEMEKAKAEGKKPIDTLSAYARFKRLTMEKLDDYGAFGDVVEVLTRISCKPASLVSWEDMHVKRQDAIDITIRKTPFEIGTNGKTFLESTEENPMNGKYKMIAYGVFESDEKLAMLKLLETGKYTEAIDNLLSMMYVFNKDEFFHDMTTKTGRGSMYTYKASLGKWQVVYNGSKHSLFLKMVEMENVPTLKEWLRK